MLSEHRNEVAATALFKQAIDHNGLPSKVVIESSGANNTRVRKHQHLDFSSGLALLYRHSQSELSQ